MPSSTSGLRIGVIGCGMISADHLAAWSNCRNAVVAAVCDSSVERARERAAQFAIAQVYDSPEIMFEQEKLDAVDIITPRETHAALVRMAARYGVHALCEKPLCPTYDEALALVQEIGSSIRVMVNENWRYRAYFKKIGEWIDAGRLGTITQARIALWRSSMLPRTGDGRIHAFTRQPFLQNEQRVLIAESLIHEIDVVRSLFGEMSLIACCTARACPALQGEDSATLLLRSKSGFPVTIDGVMTAAGHDTRAPDRLEIAGTRCSVILDNAVLRLIGEEQDTITYDESEIRQGCFNASIQHFADRLLDQSPFWTSARDQLASLQLMEQAYRSAGQPAVLTNE
ncbi:Gfo/Idh/MocA family protein [Advenella mimigardefordensis]|uniref:NAD(P)-binding Rossmann-fold domain-containing protein n=1 Tax=Advenella mimigardefordensis (strain DSM 17166 / LMG 22922 / DPN7) TaxID=1247726 RepID=W0PB33_ADVMD|nr:Gfo/Idh/MocA family oxidoreductase [Advenella mimigardefordensis]AHG62243.1 NAD(P)-binding Rossmann-fold domain-containing protein [Advenella mimigardefordensis DPN7]